MRRSKEGYDSSFIEDYADNLAESLHFPAYFEEVCLDEPERGLFEYIANKYGAEIALNVLTLATVAGVALTPQVVWAQTSNGDDIDSVYVEDIDFPEETIQASGVENYELLNIYSLDQFKDYLREGLSSKTYKLQFDNQEAYNQIWAYVRDNKVYLSTGNKMEALTPELLQSIFGDEFLFLLENDTQGSRALETSREFVSTSSGYLPSSDTTTVYELGDGLKKTVSIEIDSKGIVTNTVTYNAPWNYDASATITGKALASGRTYFAVAPSFILVNPTSGQEYFRTTYGLYTGGYFTESGLFVPNFKHEPVFKDPNTSVGFHGEIINNNLLLKTDDVKNLITISADALTYSPYADSSFPYYFIKLVNEARNKFGANYKVVITESIGAALNRHNGLFNRLNREGVNYDDFIFSFAAAGNDNKVSSWESLYPQNLTQVAALSADLSGLTDYSNYSLNEEGYIAERGSFMAPVYRVDEEGELYVTYISYHGTSMSTPLVASEAAVKIGSGLVLSPTIQTLFPDKKPIVFMGEIIGLENQPRAIAIQNTELNRVLLNIPGNGIFPENSNLILDGDWSLLNGNIYKSPSLRYINLDWNEFLRQPNSFRSGPIVLNLRDFYSYGLVSNMYAENDGIIYPVQEWNTNEFSLIINQLENSPNAISDPLTVNKLTQNVRVGGGVLRDFSSLDLDNFVYTSSLIKTNFDPEFIQFQYETIDDQGEAQKHIIYFPLVLN